MAETKLNPLLDFGNPRKFTVTYTQLSTAALTNDIELFSLPAGAYIEKVIVKHQTGFSGGALSSYKLSLGITGSLVKFHPQYEVHPTPNPVGAQTYNVNTVLGAGLENFGAATSIRVSATAVGANLNAATQGSADIWVFMTKAV